MQRLELIKLKWKQIDLESGLLYVDNREYLTKTKKVRVLPLNQTALNVLNNRLNKTGYGSNVFTYQGLEIRQDFISHKIKKIIKKAGINPKLNFHSLRHTFASWLVESGAPIYSVVTSRSHGRFASKATKLSAAAK